MGMCEFGAGSGDPIKHIEKMVDLKERGWWDPGGMATHLMKFDDVQKAYDMYEQREEEVIKSVMTLMPSRSALSGPDFTISALLSLCLHDAGKVTALCASLQ